MTSYRGIASQENDVTQGKGWET